VFVRAEIPDDIPTIRDVTQAAFAKPGTDAAVLEARLVDELRDDLGWIPALSLVAIVDGEVVGHVASTRGYVGDTPVLGLGPLSVRPDRQRRGVGLALMHTSLGAADALGEPLVALLGSREYYSRFGFVPAATLGIDAPDPNWSDYFQIRTLGAYRPATRGLFRYAEPFSRL
jgi:putative acetyltransferase